jgi:hypothetical protein
MRAFVTILLACVGCGGSTATSGVDAGAADSATMDATIGDGASDAGTDGASCASGMATIDIRANGALCVSDCGSWLTILDPNGAQVQTDFCGVACDTCAARGCGGGCQAPYGVPDGGVTATWDGTSYTKATTVTCGGATECYRKVCAPPGRYTVHACFYAQEGDAGGGTICQAAQTPTCADVPFDWPLTGVVIGDVGP